jgi:hypothetical protein
MLGLLFDRYLLFPHDLSDGVPEGFSSFSSVGIRLLFSQEVTTLWGTLSFSPVPPG